MKTWSFGIIGCGGIAAFHRDAIQELANAQLTGVSSRSEERAQHFARESQCDWTTDYHELLGNPKIEIISLTTSSGSHFRIGEDVLLAGKHLVVEKPITLEVSEAQQLIDLAKSKGLTLSVISQRRFEPQIAEVKRVLEEGRMGKLLLIEAGTPYFRSQEYYDSADWRGTIAEDGGALMNQGIHQIDLLLWLGGEVENVVGKTATQTHKMEAEDIAVAIVKFKSGTLGTIMSSTSIKPGFPSYIHLYGEKGTVKIEGQAIVHWTVEGVEAPLFPAPIPRSDGSSKPLAISHHYHKLQLEDLLLSLDQGRLPAVTGIDGKRAVELIQSICAASVAGKGIIL